MLQIPEKERIRYHLGYPEMGQAASLQFGVPIPVQTMFLLENAMNLILPEAEGRVRQLITIMDGIEQKLIDAQDRLAADQLEELKLRADEPGQLEREYTRWGYRLAEVLGVPVYAYSQRYRYGLGTAAGSIPVRH